MRRFSPASLAVAAVLIGMTASPAGAAVTIGSTFTPTEDFGGAGTFIQSTSPPANSYTVPTDGVITSWSFEAAAGTTPPLKLKVARPAGGNDFTTIGDSRLETPTGGTLNTWLTRVSVKAGDVIGHYYTGTTFSFRPAPSAGYVAHDLSGMDPVLDPPPGTTATYSPSDDLQIDVSAMLEPDCDKDGFGDETQDSQFTGSPPCPEVRCAGALATIVGTNANNNIVGTAGRDVIASLGGRDSVSGLAGNDLICGGAGKDKLGGGKGKDKLLGQGGKDTLKGGGAKDICKGGKANDSAATCEVKKSI